MGSATQVKRAVCGALIVGLAVSLIAGAAGRADAQTQPGYAPFTSSALADPDATAFDIWQIVGRWPVAQQEVQDVLDAIEPGRYSVPASAGPGKTFLTFTVRYGRANVVHTSPPAPGTYGPSSSQIFTVTGTDTQTNSSVILDILDYAEEPGPRNDFLGSDVSREGAFKWDIHEEAGVLHLKVTLNGIDGSSFRCEVTADANSPGTFTSLDPEVRPFRFLSDGPGGSHPTIRFGRKYGVLPLTSIKAKVTSGKLMTPGGIITVDPTSAQGVELRRLTQTPLKRVED